MHFKVAIQHLFWHKDFWDYYRENYFELFYTHIEKHTLNYGCYVLLD